MPILFARDGPTPTDTLTPTMITLLEILIPLLLVALCLVGVLLLLRHFRRRQRQRRAQQGLLDPPSSTLLPLHSGAGAPAMQESMQLAISASRSASNAGRPASHKHRRTASIVISERQAFLTPTTFSAPMSPSTPTMAKSQHTSALPEIRITFPDDDLSESSPQDAKYPSERVVVVRIGDSGSVVGLEPYAEEPLPPYAPRPGEQWSELDLDQLGGLKEKQFDDRD